MRQRLPYDRRLCGAGNSPGLKIQKPRNEKATHRALERRYLKWLWHNKQKHIVWLRLLYRFLAPRHKKPLWIVSDREEVAGDNGEAFFRFLAKEQPADIDYAFVINKGCPDDKRMRRYGRVLHFGTCDTSWPFYWQM